MKESTYSSLNNPNRWIFENIDKEYTTKKLVEVRIKPHVWQDLDSFIVVPFSISSAIYDGIDSDFKIKSFINTIKYYANNKKILILLCEGAHLNALTIEHKNIDDALAICINTAKKLLKRFEDNFSGCEIAFWTDFVWKHNKYNNFKYEIIDLFKTDVYFSGLMKDDAKQLLQVESNFNKFLDSELFYFNTQLDFLEMMTGISIMHEENYKILIYPGSLPNSFKYLYSLLNLEIVFINAGIKCKDITHV